MGDLSSPLTAGIKYRNGICADSSVFLQFQAVKLSAANTYEPCATTDADSAIAGICLVDRNPGDSRTVPIAPVGSDTPVPVLLDGSGVVTAGSATVGNLTISGTVAGRFKPAAAGAGLMRAITSGAATQDGLAIATALVSGSSAGGISLSTANTWTASQNVAAVALTDAASIATNLALGNVFTVTLAGNRTLANPTNPVSGGTYQWIVTQDATGSRTLAYGANFAWPGGVAPTLSTAASAVDMITATWDGLKYRAVAQLAFA